MDTLMQKGAALGALLKSRGETVAISESSTGGLVSASLLAVSGASAYFLGGGVIYTREARRALLGLPEKMVTMRGATEAYALICARAMRDKIGSAWAIAETGATGPSGNRYGDAAGHCCKAIVGPVERAMTLETGLADREANMWRFAETCLAFAAEVIGEA
ncbi:MAG: CinA family protein [Rhodospirillaceae bacterium]